MQRKNDNSREAQSKQHKMVEQKVKSVLTNVGESNL
jgi:hypothetical protein